MVQKNLSSLALWAILIVAFMMIYNIVGRSDTRYVQTSEFIELVEDGTVGWAKISGGTVSGISKDGRDKIRTYIGEPKRVRDLLIERRIPFQETVPDDGSGFYTAMMLFLPLLLFFLMFRFMRAQMGGAGGGRGAGNILPFGNHKAKLAQTVNERFTDVAGIDEAVEEVRDIADYLKHPEKFRRLGGRMPKGTLLVGPPGTGKTLLARALAGEASVPFLSLSGSDFVEMFVGVGASRVRDLFAEARKQAPCIIFIDELDAMGKARGGVGVNTGGNDEREQTLNQLLVEMDGFEAQSGIMVIAATNRPDVLDTALLRPGRFDRQVYVPAPDRAGRKQILGIHVRKGKVVTAPDLDYDRIAKDTAGLTGATLESLVNEAALRASKSGKTEVDTEDFLQSIEKVLVGLERKGQAVSEKERRIVAWHEAGHAVTAWYTPDADPPRRVSIIPRGRARGYTLLNPEEERHLIRRKQLLAMIQTSLGGRVAEIMLLGEDDYTGGASDDLARVTAVARDMVTRLGMSAALGHRAFGRRQETILGEHESRDYSEETANEIDAETSAIIEDQLNATRALLESHRDRLESLADALLAEETVDEERLLQILGSRGDG